MTKVNRNTHRKTELVKDLTEKLDLVLHIGSTLIPEAFFFSLLKGNSSGFLERRHTAVADAGVCTGHILDQVLRANKISNTPAGGIEGLAGGTDGQGSLVQLRRQSGNSRKGDIEETVIDLIRQNNQVVLNAEVADALELLSGEDLANGVVPV